MAPKKQKSEKKNPDKTTNIEPGMVVETTKGDLGEGDVSKPKVTEVVQDQHCKVDKLLVQKGVIFKKTLEIPADRIASINQECSVDESVPGKVIVDVSKKEAFIPIKIADYYFLCTKYTFFHPWLCRQDMTHFNREITCC